MSRGRFSIDGVYDIECAGWDRFVCGEILDVNGERFVTWDERRMFRELVSRKGRYFALAGGRYDALWALAMAVKERIPWSARMRGAGVLSVQIGDVELLDSYAIVPMRLAKAAGLAGRVDLSKLEFPLACRCPGDVDCGGYCALDRKLTAAERRKVEEYLHVDCEVLLAVLLALADRFERNGIRLGMTVGGTAWATARAELGLSPAKHTFATYCALREGYFGGRNEVYRMRAARGHRHDIHSSYPAALTRVHLPIGEPTYLEGSAARRAYLRGDAGIFSADMHVRDCFLPPLPVRVEERLLYPVGPASGSWTGLLLRHAEEHGASVRKIRSAYVWRESAPILRPFCERIWALRAAHLEAAEAREAVNDPLARCERAWAEQYKWLANSLTGKFGQKPLHASLKSYPCERDGTRPSISEECIPLLENEWCTIGALPVTRVDECAHVEWCAHLTADATSELHRQLLAAREPIYSDTDSVYAVDRIRRRAGDGLGEWGYEGTLRDWRALAPKVYQYTDDDGEHVTRGKGLSGLTAAGFERLAQGQAIDALARAATPRSAARRSLLAKARSFAWEVTSGVEGLRTQLARDGALFKRRRLARMVRASPGWCGGRETVSGSDVTHPTTIERWHDRGK